MPSDAVGNHRQKELVANFRFELECGTVSVLRNVYISSHLYLKKKSHSFICVKQKDEGRNLRHSGYKNKQNIGLFIEVDPKNVSILQIVSGEETVS